MPGDSPTKPPDEGWSPESTFGEELTAQAPKYGIVFHDDDTTPVDFVMHLLENYLGFSEQDARNMVASIAINGEYEVARFTRGAAQPLFERILRAIDHSDYNFRVTLNEDP